MASDESMSKRVMVAIDDSEGAEKAFHLCLSLMDREQDHLELVSIIEVGEDENSQRLVTTRLEKYKSEAKEHGVKSIEERLLFSKEPGPTLVEHAKENGTETIFVGRRRGLSSIRRFFVGSTSRYLIENATCCVVIAKVDVSPAA
mmetsp:Transcript_9353/g.12587  ORF Transcript_9353/g.12587 Transcript_9353/m.12587 type:complete len:145 (-) Transcript_9353:49-483(-)